MILCQSLLFKSCSYNFLIFNFRKAIASIRQQLAHIKFKMVFWLIESVKLNRPSNLIKYFQNFDTTSNKSCNFYLPTTF